MLYGHVIGFCFCLKGAWVSGVKTGVTRVFVSGETGSPRAIPMYILHLVYFIVANYNGTGETFRSTWGSLKVDHSEHFVCLIFPFAIRHAQIVCPPVELGTYQNLKRSASAAMRLVLPGMSNGNELRCEKCTHTHLKIANRLKSQWLHMSGDI